VKIFVPFELIYSSVNRALFFLDPTTIKAKASRTLPPTYTFRDGGGGLESRRQLPMIFCCTWILDVFSAPMPLQVKHTLGHAAGFKIYLMTKYLYRYNYLHSYHMKFREHCHAILETLFLHENIIPPRTK
jgi:hypothetical protein